MFTPVSFVIGFSCLLPSPSYINCQSLLYFTSSSNGGSGGGDSGDAQFVMSPVAAEAAVAVVTVAQTIGCHFGAVSSKCSCSFGVLSLKLRRKVYFNEEEL